MLLMDMEVAKLNNYREQFDNKKITMETLQTQIVFSNQIMKLARFDLEVQIARMKYGRKMEGMVKDSNLLNGTMLLQLSTNEKSIHINCQYHKDPISKEQCLDYSGQADNVANCQECEHFSSTRQVMLGDD